MSANQQPLDQLVQSLRAAFENMTVQEIRQMPVAAYMEDLLALYVQQREEQEARTVEESRGEEHVEEVAPSTPDKRIGGKEPRSAPGAPRCVRYA
jgi:hypothetical protein